MAKRNKRMKAGRPRRADHREELEVALQMQRAGLHDQAVRAYKAVLKKSPRDHKAAHLLGTAYFDKNDPRQAEVWFRKVVKLRPRSAPAHGNLGKVLQKLGRLEESVKSFQRASKFEPGSINSISNLGHAWQAMGRLDEAGDCFEKALEIEPDSARALLNMGNIHQKFSRFDEALDCYSRALDLKPKSSSAHYALATLFEERSMPGKAMEHYRAAADLSPDNDRILNNLGILKRYLPLDDDDLASIAKEVESKPEDVGAALHLGKVLLRRGDAQAASTIFETAAGQDAGNGEARYYLGAARARLGRDRQSVEHYKAALEINPGEVFATAALASLEAGEPARDLARNAKRVALHLGQKFHYAILRPVFDALLELGHAVVLTPHISTLVEFRPDVVVVAESQSALLRSLLPDTLFVWVRHGLISKNTTTYAARICDFACLTSDESKAWYIARGGHPRKGFWITGYPQMDPLFSGADLPLGLALPAGQKVVLYAPTWTGGLSSAPMLEERVAQLIRGDRDDLTILLKPHPATASHHPDWLEAWARLAENDPNLFLIADTAADIMPYLKAADLLVSDASSVIFQYLAVDRPIVLISNPQRFGVSHFDPGGLEWQRRDIAIEVENVADLAAAVSHALENPEAKARQRGRCRDDLFGERTDGRAASRIAQKITELEL